MAKGKSQIAGFIKSTDTRSKSVDPTDENLSVIDVGKDFVSQTQQSVVTPLTGTNITSGKNRND